MATTSKARKAAPKSTRSETVSVRLDPKLRYLIEIAARVQRRTVSSYIDWAVERSLDANVVLGDPADQVSVATLADVGDKLWDVDEADRFAKLALLAPHLLDYDEQRLWKLVREYGYLWRGRWKDTGNNTQRFTWETVEPSLHFERLREVWPVLQGIAAGRNSADALPKWVPEREDPSGEIPF